MDFSLHGDGAFAVQRDQARFEVPEVRASPGLLQADEILEEVFVGGDARKAPRVDHA